jgi:hypothetical protein
VYQDSAIDLGLWKMGEGDFEPADELIKAGQQLIGEATAEPGTPARARRKRFGFGLRLRAGLVAASLLSIVAITVWWGLTERGLVDEFATYRIPDQPIREAVRTVSRSSQFLLPGALTVSRHTDFSMRSGYFPSNKKLDASLDSLRSIYDKNTASPDDAYCLIAGNLARGEYSYARRLAESALGRFSDDPKIKIIQAMFTTYEARFDTAQVLLREVISNHAGESIAGIAGFNLVLVLEEQGKPAQATNLLAELTAQYANTPLEERLLELQLELKSR